MYRMTILYGMPEDPEHFRTYHRDTHIPLARRMQGLTGGVEFLAGQEERVALS